MSSRFLRRSGLYLLLLVSLVCCASLPQESTGQDAPAVTTGQVALRLVYTADSKGNYEHCPT